MRIDTRTEIMFLPRYAAVGFLTFWIDATTFAVLIDLFGKSHVGFVSIAAGFTGWGFNFFSHRTFTFGAVTKRPVIAEMAPHFAMKLCNEIIRGYLMYSAVVSAGWNVVAPYLFFSILIAVTNFCISRWIFARSNPLHILPVIRIMWRFSRRRLRTKLRKGSL